ncbi:MAG: ATP-binding protein [Burkholderiales bacterium]
MPSLPDTTTAPPQKSLSTRFSVTQSEFLHERIALLYRLSGEDTPMILLVASIAVFALWGVVKVSLLLAWALWLIAASVARFLLARLYQRVQPPPDQAARWENIFCLVSTTLGAGWGMSLLVVTSQARSVPELTVAFLLSTISMGLPPSLAPSPKAFVSFVLPILAPVVAMMFASGGEVNTATGLLLLIFTGVLLSLYISAHRALMTTLARGRENANLLDKLREAEKSVSAALREQETIFETAAVGLAFVTDGKIVRCNRRLGEILGRAQDDLTGKPLDLLDSVASRDRSMPMSGRHAATMSAAASAEEISHRRSDGTLQWLAVESRHVEPGNALAGKIVSIIDITERKTVEAELMKATERIDLAVRTSALSVWEWDEARGSLYMDAAWPVMLRAQGKESYLTLSEMEKLIHPEDVERANAVRIECIKGIVPHLSMEFRVHCATGEWIWIHTQGEVVERDQGGRARRLVGTNVNVSQRKLAEAELFAALQREKELNEMKSKFVSIASHELRTPLTNILSSAELLQHYSATLSDEDRAKLLEAIKDAVLGMTTLINDVLLIGRSGSGKLKFNPVALDLEEALSGLVDALRFSHGAKHQLVFKCELQQRQRLIDEQLLRHIVINLLTNALKYSNAGTTVSFSAAESGDEVSLTFVDQGIGIPNDDLPKLFESFHRAANVGDRPGTGLGLAIVKSAAELHGGGILVTSQIGVGSTFRVRIIARPT